MREEKQKEKKNLSNARDKKTQITRKETTYAHNELRKQGTRLPYQSSGSGFMARRTGG